MIGDKRIASQMIYSYGTLVPPLAYHTAILEKQAESPIREIDKTYPTKPHVGDGTIATPVQHNASASLGAVLLQKST